MSEISPVGVPPNIVLYVVEDDGDLREEVELSLNERGFTARGFPGSRELYRGLLEAPCDILILDIGLPGEDGFSVLEYIRSTTQIGVIMFRARGQTEDRVRALMAGADIYLVKPVDMDELSANIISLFRRMPRREGARAETTPCWRLSADGWHLLAPAGERVALSALERTLLEVLLRDPGATVTREALVDALGQHPDEVLSNRLDMLISRLRRKISQATGLLPPLYSVRGVGFFLPPSATFASA